MCALAAPHTQNSKSFECSSDASDQQVDARQEIALAQGWYVQSICQVNIVVFGLTVHALQRLLDQDCSRGKGPQTDRAISSFFGLDWLGWTDWAVDMLRLDATVIRL